MTPEELRTRWLNRALDVTTAQPVVRAVHGLRRLRAQARARAHDVAVTRLEQVGVATRIDLAGVEAELGALVDVTQRLTDAVAALEATLTRLPAAPDPRPGRADKDPA